MDNAVQILGFVLMAAGVALIIVGIFRTLRGIWTFGFYEVWAVPVAGLVLVLLGRWLIQ